MNLVDGVPQTPEVHISPFYNHTFSSIPENHGDKRPVGTVAIHENFVSVGGQLPGQNPFVVGLTSGGVFEFSIVGKNGTSTLGMVEVMAPGLYISKPHPAQNLADYLRERRSQRTNDRRELTTLESFGIAVACFTGLFIIFKMISRRKMKNSAAAEARRQEQEQQRLERRRQQQEQYGDIELSTRGANARIGASDPAVIAYEEQIANQYITHDSRLDLSTSVGEPDLITSACGSDDGQAPVYTRHPRPNVITSLGNGA